MAPHTVAKLILPMQSVLHLVGQAIIILKHPIVSSIQHLNEKMGVARPLPTQQPALSIIGSQPPVKHLSLLHLQHHEVHGGVVESPKLEAGTLLDGRQASPLLRSKHAGRRIFLQNWQKRHLDWSFDRSALFGYQEKVIVHLDGWFEEGGLAGTRQDGDEGTTGDSQQARVRTLLVSVQQST